MAQAPVFLSSVDRAMKDWGNAVRSSAQLGGIGILQAGAQIPAAFGNAAAQGIVDRAAKEKDRLDAQLQQSSDASQIVASLFANPVNYLPLGAATRTGAGVAGGVTGALAPVGEGESRIGNAMLGTAVGLGLKTAAPIAGKVVKATGKAAAGAVNTVTDAVKKVIPFDADAIAFVKTAPEKDLEPLASAFRSSLKAGEREIAEVLKGAKAAGLTGKQAKAYATITQNGGVIALPDLLQDSAGQTELYLARQGVYGAKAKEDALLYNSQKQQFLRDTLSDVTRRLSGGSDLSAINDTEVSQGLTSALRSAYSRDSGAVRQLYGRAEEVAHTAYVNGADITPVVKDITKHLSEKEGFRAKYNPRIASHIRDLAGMAKAKGGKVSVSDLNLFLKQVRATANSTHEDARLASKLASRFDEARVALSEGGKVYGSEEAVTSIKGADKAYKALRQKYGQDDNPIYRAVSGRPDIKPIGDTKLANILFGSGPSLKLGADAHFTQVAGILGEDAPELGGVRGLALKRMIGHSLEGDSLKEFSGEGFQSRVEKALMGNKAAFERVFGANADEIRDKANAAYYLTRANRDKMNPSGTASPLLQVGMRAVEAVPGVGQAATLAKAAVATVGRERKGAAISKMVTDADSAILKGLSGAAARPLDSAVDGVVSNSTTPMGIRQAATSAVQAVNRDAPADGGEWIVSPDEVEVIEPDVSLPASKIQQYAPVPEYVSPDDVEVISSYDVPDSLINDEGIRSEVYRDTRGKRTVGIGFNMDDPASRNTWASAGIAKDFDAVREGAAALDDAEISALANVSYNNAFDTASKHVKGFHRLPPAKQEALVNMAYQLGDSKFREFKRMRGALAAGKFSLAAREVLSSDYAQQVPERASRIAAILQS